MATRGDTVLTLADWVSRLTPSGSVESQIVELMNEQNAIFDDILWKEGNLPTGHQGVIRTGLPSSTWRLLNYGVAASKSETQMITDTCGMLEQYGQVDKDLANLNGNTEAFLRSEAKPHIEGMVQDFCDTLIYGNTDAYPERFLGFAYRYPYTVTNNVINAGGSGSDVTSIWLVVWGENTVHGIFPKGSKAGITYEDLGQQTYTDSNGLMHQVLRQHYQLKCGLHVKDWRYVVRIANVESAIPDSSTATTNGYAPELMAHALGIVPSLSAGNPVFYCSRDMMIQINQQAMNKSNVHYTVKDINGVPVTHFWGVPIRRVDSILNTETAIGAS